ncbi:MAG: tetratricopeptide repeat protein [Candidatus Acidiferrales bacterium]
MRPAAVVLLLVLSAFAPTVSPVAAQEPPAQPKERKKKSVPLVIEEREVIYRVENSGEMKIRERMKVHILTQEGREAFGQVGVPYRSRLGEVKFEFVRTLRSSGEVLEAAVDSPLEIPAAVTQQAPQFTDLMIKVVPASGLQVGDRLEYGVLYTLNKPFKPGDFWLSHIPIRQLKVGSERVTLDLPAERAVEFKSDEATPPSVEEADGRRVYRWTLSNPEPRKGKVLTKQLFNVSSLQSWADVGAWYLELQSDRAVLTPELTELANRLVAGKTDRRERLEAVYTYVSQSVRYVSISLGLGGYQAHPAAEVSTNQYGDCKDKHTLLAVLLSAVGLEAYPALLNVGIEIEADVPSPGEFNHVISVVPLGEDWIWLDTTQEVAPLGFLPRVLRGKKALLVQAGESRLLEIPEDSSIDDAQRTLLKGEVDAKGTLSAHLRYETRGQYEVRWRTVFRRANREAIDFALKLNRPYSFWNAETQPATSSDPLELSQPFTYGYDLTQKSFLNPLQKSIRFAVPAFALETLPWRLPKESSSKDNEEEEEEEEADTENDFELGGPVELEDAMELTVSPELKVHVPATVHEATEFATYDSTAELREGTLVVHRRLHVLKDKWPKEQHEEVRAFSRVVSQDRDQELLVQRLGALDVRAQAQEMNADDLNRAGYDALQKGDILLARDLLDLATQKEPQHKFAWNNLGMALLSMGRIEEAQAAFEKQVRINPRDEFAYNNLGRSLVARGRFDEAIAAFQKQLEIKPLDPSGQVNLASLYEQLERWPEAEAAFEKALAISPDNPALLVSRGRAQLHLGKTPEARASFDRALRLSGIPPIYNNIAYALAETKQELPLARRYAQSAVLLVETELRLVDSLQQGRRLLMLQTSLGSFLDTLGWIHFQQGEVEKAAVYLEAAGKLILAVEVAEHLAHVRAAQGRMPEALSGYAQAVHWARGRPVTTPEALAPYVAKELGGAEGLTKKIKELAKQFSNLRPISPEGGSFSWPAGAPTDQEATANVICLVDETGSVLEVEAFAGEEPWRSAAAEDSKKLRFPVVSWGGEGLPTLRSLKFFYHPGGKVEAKYYVALPASPAESEENVQEIFGPLLTDRP